MATSFEGFTGEIHVIARLVAQPGKVSQLLSELAKVKSHISANEPGTLQYDVLQYGDEVCVVEKYKDTEALKAHSTSEPMKEVMGKLKDIVVEGGFSLKAYETAKL